MAEFDVTGRGMSYGWPSPVERPPAAVEPVRVEGGDMAVAGLHHVMSPADVEAANKAVVAALNTVMNG